VACARHAVVEDHRGQCPACLLEGALSFGLAIEAAVPVPHPPPGGTSRLTIQVPLGESPFASVFLAKSDGPPLRLLRLKTWKNPAPLNFLERFRELRARLDDWAEACVPAVLAAATDPTGCPSVLSEFRQGVPLLASLGSNGINLRHAMEQLDVLRERVVRGHARGLIHGSITPGNILLQPGQDLPHLLDFGLGPLTGRLGSHPYSAGQDLAGIAAIVRLLGGSAADPVNPGPL
jgi:serine/threonine protein kinase